jgi:hypothetical protein
VTGGKCEGCRTASDCTDPTKPVCDSTHTCVPNNATLADGQPCTASTQCTGGTCLDEPTYGRPNGYCSGTCTTPGSTCPGGGICIGGNGSYRCVEKCTCSGTNCSNNGSCRVGYGCMNYMVDYTGSSATALVCEPLCDKNSQCANGTCNLYSGFCTAILGLAKNGSECSSNSDCESRLCLTEADQYFPGGYCASSCLIADKICPDSGYCATSGSTDASGTCFQSCVNSSTCSYYDSCQTYSGNSICYPFCWGVGGSCSRNTDCCYWDSDCGAGNTCT